MSKAFFTEKHYQLICNMIRDSEIEDKGKFAYHCASYLQITNPKFKRDRFLTACGVANGTNDSSSSNKE